MKKLDFFFIWLRNANWYTMFPILLVLCSFSILLHSSCCWIIPYFLKTEGKILTLLHVFHHRFVSSSVVTQFWSIHILTFMHCSSSSTSVYMLNMCFLLFTCTQPIFHMHSIKSTLSIYYCNRPHVYAH